MQQLKDLLKSARINFSGCLTKEDLVELATRHGLQARPPPQNPHFQEGRPPAAAPPMAQPQSQAQRFSFGSAANPHAKPTQANKFQMDRWRYWYVLPEARDALPRKRPQDAAPLDRRLEEVAIAAGTCREGDSGWA